MKKYVIVILAIVITGAVFITYNNQFDMIIKDKTIHSETGNISIEYATPKVIKEKPGLILFIHGDGPVNKNSDTGYYSAWETLAKENIISISWDKAGVGDSTGNWLKQDMMDRKEEAEKVLDWAIEELNIDSNKVGVWGASQRGWVITKLLNENNNIKFAIGVAPAVNWMRQGTFNTINEMEYEGYTQEEIDTKIVVNDKINEYLRNNDYQGYVDSQLEEDLLPKDRWDFIYRNMMLDNTDELEKINKPYYLLIGDNDINVDMKETEKVYIEAINKDYLTVYPISNATHRMLKPRHQKDNSLTFIEAIFNPREIFSPDYLKALQEIGKTINNSN